MLSTYAKVSHRPANLLIIILVLLIGLVVSLSASSTPASAAACSSEPPSVTGRASQTITIDETATYTVWSRIKAPDSNPAEYTIYIDGQCFVVGQTVLSAGNLEWVDYQNGESTEKVTIDLSAGEHTVVMTAGSDGLELDRVMFLADACQPSGTGDNCLSDTQNPTVNLTNPTAGDVLTDNVMLTASASDNDSIDYVEFYYDDTLLGSDSSAPYSFSWDTTAVADGVYTLTVRAYDVSGNTTTSAAVDVTVANSPPVDASITSFTASPATITQGDDSTLAWSVAQGTDCSIDQGIGSVANTGATTVSPSSTTTYTLSCDGVNGGSVDSATSTVSVMTPPEDSDNDGIPDAVEDAGPNNGDANYDGIPDSQQPDVVTLLNAKTGQYNTLVATGDCTQFQNASSAVGQAVDNLHGVWSFSLACDTVGGSAEVAIYLDAIYSTDRWRALKLSSDLQTQTDISDTVSYESRQLGDQNVTALVYNLTDGGDLDEDGLADGMIVDPLAVQDVVPDESESPAVIESDNPNQLADTGADTVTYLIAGMVLLFGGLWLVVSNRSTVFGSRKV